MRDFLFIRAAVVLRTLRPRTAAATAAVARAACAFVPLLALADPTAGQQFVTDDAAIVEFRACQLEGWHGESASWLLPACQLLRNLELTAGIGFVREDGSRSTEYVLQGKYLFREVGPGRVGIGIVGGLGFGPLSQVVGDGVAGGFAYVPVSLSLADDRALLHANLGWHYERDEHFHNGVLHREPHHALTWAARADLLLPGTGERLSLIGELFGEDRVRPEYQLGVRVVAVPDRLELDLSWAGHTARGFDGAGWAAGLAWTPPPFRS